MNDPGLLLLLTAGAFGALSVGVLVGWWWRHDDFEHELDQVWEAGREWGWEEAHEAMPRPKCRRVDGPFDFEVSR